MKTVLTIACFMAFALSMQAQSQRIELPPTMGWSSWNTYHAEINEELIKMQASALVEKGLAKKGYKYVNIDDGFQKLRDNNGQLLIDDVRFPHGLEPVVSHVHGLGLKAGIYSDAGIKTCASIWAGETGGAVSGLYGHEQQDCDYFFKDLKFDFIKVDFCGGEAKGSNTLALSPQQRYTDIAKAIANTGCNVQYNLCRWAFPGTWAIDIADSWRTTQDIESNWPSVKSIINQNLYLSAYCKFGHYNDLDMLEVGVTRDGILSKDETITHFGMWCMMSSPLLIGCDVTSLSDEDLVLLGNEELIALNQDTLGLQAYVVSNQDGAYVLVKDFETLHGRKRAVAFYNPNETAKEMMINFADLDLAGNVQIRDLVHHENLGNFEGQYAVTLQPHASQFMLFTADERLLRTKYEAETAFLTAYHETGALDLCAVPSEAMAANCSGRVKVIALGGIAKDSMAGTSFPNDLVWQHVYVPQNTSVTLNIAYTCENSQDMHVSVNGKDLGNFSCCSGSANVVSNLEISTKLKAGDNVIRLYNDEGVMPDIDCLTLNFPKSAKSKDVKMRGKKKARR